jgi:hypothetical protein
LRRKQQVPNELTLLHLLDLIAVRRSPPVSDINAEAVGGAVRLAGPEIVSPELVDVDSNLRNSTMSQPYTRGLEAMADS